MLKSQKDPLALPNVPHTSDGQEWQAMQRHLQLLIGLEEDQKKKLESWRLMLRSDAYWVS